jgi:hypothetical protein
MDSQRRNLISTQPVHSSAIERYLTFCVARIKPADAIQAFGVAQGFKAACWTLREFEREPHAFREDLLEILAEDHPQLLELENDSEAFEKELNLLYEDCYIEPDVWLYVGCVETLMLRDRLLYADSRNPLHAWRAYGRQRALAVPIPDWVFAAFDCFADRIALAVDTKADSRTLLKALDLASLGGGPGRSRQAIAEIHRWEAVWAMLREQRNDAWDSLIHGRAPRGDAEIMDEVAENLGVTTEHVRNCYYALTEPTNGDSENGDSDPRSVVCLRRRFRSC